jgi:hypothetical protein
VTIWAWEPLTTKSRKGWPQTIEKSAEKIWKSLGKPFQDISKEAHQKDKEIYREVV